MGKYPEAMLWYSIWRNPKKGMKSLGHGATYVMLRELADKVGIKKRIYPHLFRHSRATALANKLTESQMKGHFGFLLWLVKCLYSKEERHYQAQTGGFSF